MWPTAPDVADAVLGVAAPQRTRRFAWTLVAAFLVHAMVLGGAGRMARRPAAAGAVAAPVRTEVAIDLGPVQPRSPPPPAATPDRAPPVRRQSAARAPSARAPAAEAATVIARAADSDAPVDLTADAVVMGKAVSYAGGRTAADVTGRSPGAEFSAGSRPGPGTSPAAAGRGSPVSLATEDWSCPWPAEADADQIDEQTVVLRVVVNASGDPQSAAVLADPGHGFAAAARACAMRTHFTPARDARGVPVAATSPPIRVRFTR